MGGGQVDVEALAGDPERVLGALRATWGALGSHLDEGERLPDDGLAVERRDVGGTRGLLVTLPEALRVPEAVFVMVAPLGPPSARRFFTLESGWDVAGRKRCTVLGEWSEGGHTTLGDGPPAAAGAFVTAVAEVLSREV